MAHIWKIKMVQYIHKVLAHFAKSWHNDAANQ